MKLLTKAGLSLASLTLASNVQAAQPNITVPSTKPDDGRTSLAKTYDKDLSWYLSVPLLPYTNLTDCLMIGDIVNIAKNFPEPDFDNFIDDNDSFNKQNIEDFITDLKNLPRVDSSLNVNPSLRFGFFTKWFEMHSYTGIEGNAALKFNSIKGDYVIDETEKEVRFDSEQKVLEAVAYADIVSSAKFIVPVTLSDIVLKPFLAAGYRHREMAQFSFYTPDVIDSEDDLELTDTEMIRTNGDGFFISTGIKADFSRLEKYFQPVVALEVENVYSRLFYSNNPLSLSVNDPVKLNLGFQINPFNVLKLRADFLDLANRPEFRVEVNRQFGVLDLALYGRLNQSDVLGNVRHSVNLYFGIAHDIVNFGLYGSLDNHSNFGAGLMLSLGWHPWYRE